MDNIIARRSALFLLNLLLYVFLVVAMVVFSKVAGAQSVNMNEAKYRVTAFKVGDHSVFSQSNTAKIAPPLSLYIPTAFTPNNDGLNDRFGVAGQGIAAFEMKIYNSWGELIFESANANEQWDGTHKGVKVPEDVYMYRVSVRSFDGDMVFKNGNITLLQ